MGFISRRVLPICGNMCVCCPGLRSRSRQPVKRYKKLLSQIFPKTIDGPVNERRISKLCEYAAKNPLRIPKIAKYLEQRSSKELRCEHVNFVKIIMEVYNKLLCMCKEQMAYFAANLLNVILELLDNTRQDATRILGCQTLTIFIYSQADSTYTHNIESLVRKVCMLAREAGEEHEKCCLRASSLQCLSAMLWFMAEFSQIFADFDEIVHVTLDNYEGDPHLDDDEERGESHHNWVDEVVRCEGRGGAGVGNDVNANYMIIRSRPEIKDPSILTREEIETPKVWARICIQKMVELAKESTTMRRVLDPMFIYFDTGRHWAPRQGLALVVLSDMSYLMESSGNAQLVLAAIIRHLDHKNVAKDPQIKSDIIQVAAFLARQFRSQAIVAEIGVVSDLCRHLRKSLQATVELFGQQESNCNISLQNSIEDCLLEIAKGIGDARPLFDMMAITLEKLPSVGVVARAIIGSLLILAHIISLASVYSHSQQFFPEALLLQLLKTMMHPDVEARVLTHQIYAVLLVPTSHYPKHEFASSRSEYLYEPRKWDSKTASAFASATALLEKLRRENEVVKVDKNATDAHDDLKDREVLDEEWRHGRVRKNSPNFYKLSCSIIEKTAKSTSSIEAEPNIVRLSEDQTSQLLSALWIQANLPDNLPSNFEAIGYSFSLTLLSSRLKNTNHNVAVRFFQLPLSLRKVSLDPNGILSPSCRRSLFTLATAMLMFAAKTYHISEMNELLKSLISFDVDQYLKIGDDLQVYVPPLFSGRDYGSTADQHAAASSLSELMNAVSESDEVLLDIMVRGLLAVTETNVNDLAMQLSETFTPDDAFLFDPQSIFDLDHIQMIALSKESLSFDEDFPTSSQIEDDVVSEFSAADFPRFITKMPASPSLSHIISVGQLLESALEVAGHVAGTSISSSPLPYSTMAGHCEALGTSTNQKAPASNKLRWGELEEDDGEDLDFLLPPRVVVGPDEHGVKKVIEYKFDDDGNKVKMTTTTRTRKLAKARLSKRAVERRGWPKFGDAAHEDAGSRLTMVSTEEILIEKPRAPGSKAEETKVAGDPLAALGKGGAVLMVCRTCGKKGDHWTSKCPYKDLAPQAEGFVDRPPTSETPAPASGASKGGTYVPPGMRGGAERSGIEMRRRNEENSVRVTNLSEDTREPDLLELFRTFGAVSRVYVAVDQKTGMSRGFGFVNFVNKEDAERAINKLNGYGYDNLILRVEWATPRAN